MTGLRSAVVRGVLHVVLFSSLAASALLPGCGVYLHDDSLQKQTDALLATYKTADVAGAMKAALDAQLALDRAELQAVADNETAERERAIADLISSNPLYGNGPAILRLEKRVADRIGTLAPDVRIDPAEWVGMQEKLIEDRTLFDSLRRTLLVLQRRYVAAGGTNFTSCETFRGAEGVPESLQASARNLKAACKNLEGVSKPSAPVQRALKAVFQAKGDLKTVHGALADATKQIVAVAKARDDALRDLQKAQAELKRTTKDRGAIDAEVTARLNDVVGALKKVDELAASGGDPSSSIGSSLAAIQFRKVNLRDVLVASTGGDATGPASDAQRAIVGASAGVVKLARADDAPSVPALSVALAYQDGLEKAAQARLDALTRRRALLDDQENSLLRELELLAVAQQAIGEARDALSSRSCAPRGFVDVFPNESCPAAARAAAARALTAYHLSWASGRTAARLDDRRITQLLTWQRLRTSQEAAVARSNIQMIALTQLAAYGQGGIKPETIAAFLQAFGLAAIAKGVN